jgi:hypothetical protein
MNLWGRQRESFVIPAEAGIAQEVPICYGVTKCGRPQTPGDA